MKQLYHKFLEEKIPHVALFILFLILIYVPIIVNIFVIYRRTIDVVKEEKMTIAQQTLKETSHTMELVLKDIDETTHELMELSSIKKVLENYETFTENQVRMTTEFINEKKLVEFEEKNPYIKKIITVSHTGIVFSTHPEETFNSAEFLKDSLIQQLNTSDGNLWYAGRTPFSFYTDVEEPFVTIGKMKSIDSTKTVGYVLVFLDKQLFQSLYKDLSIGTSGKIHIMDHQSNVLFSHDICPIPSETVISYIDNSKFHEINQIKANDTSYTFAIAPLLNTNWFEVLSIPTHELTDPIALSLNNSFKWILVISLLIGLLLLFEMMMFSKINTQKEMARYRLESSEKLNYRLRIYKHDFMNHLQIIQCLLEMNQPGRAIDYLQNVTEQGKSIRQNYEIGIPELESAIFTTIESAAKHNIHVEIDTIHLPDQLPMKKYDLVKIITNLLKNAVYALQHTEADEKILTIKISMELDEYIFEISNNVPIIPEEIKEQIFAKGFTTKNKEGDGLGLYIVKKLVEKNKGTLSLKVDSEGNHFTVKFPNILNS